MSDDVKKDMRDVGVGLWNLFVHGQLPKEVKRCERCNGKRSILFAGAELPCPLCCHEDGSLR